MDSKNSIRFLFLRKMLTGYFTMQEEGYGKKLYSGKIASMDWKEREKAYVNTYYLDYDQLGKLTSDKESGPHFKGAFHFVDGANEDVEYTYDANGNMTQDLNKGIQGIEYNVLNLPVVVNFKLRDEQTGLVEKKSIEYFYDSDGGKRTVVYTDGETSTDDNTLCYSYTENRIFEDGELRLILFNGGYVTFKDGKPQYHFYLQDHLGNNRIVADSQGNIEQTNTYYPFGALIQDGFSEDITSTQRYKYNGKELDRMFGMDWYDFGARMYDPCMIRWNGMDPLCEKYYSISPYAYCANDPINAIDKDGKDIVVLLAPKGANGFGHMALLVQNDKNKWTIWSKNGTEENYGLWGKEPSIGHEKHNNRGADKYNHPKEYNTIDAFSTSKENPIEENNEREYTKGYYIKTNKEQDKKAIKAIRKSLNTNYNVWTANCAEAVQDALKAAGLNPGKGKLPKLVVYPSIKKANKGIEIILKK